MRDLARAGAATRARDRERTLDSRVFSHRGAKTRDDSARFRFEDPSGLLEWLAPTMPSSPSAT
jgi:hypothetical protein